MEFGTQLQLGLELPQGISSGIQDVASQFLDHCRSTKGLSLHTQRAYKSDLRDFGRQIGNGIAAKEVTREQILAYVRALRERGLCESTVKRRVATLKVLFHWMERDGLIATNVVHRLDLAIRLPKRLPRALEAREMQLLLRLSEAEALSATGADIYDKYLVHVAVIIMFAAGLRVSELVSLQLADLSIKEAALLVHGKGNRERRVYLPSRRARRAVDQFLAKRRRLPKGDSLLMTTSGMPVTSQWVRSRLRSLAVRAGLTKRVTPHMLRHTAATQLLEAGVDIRYVQKLLGHSSIATTQIYTHVTDSSLRDQLTRADTLGRLRKAV